MSEMTKDELIAYYRGLYEGAKSRADALEKQNDRLHEREALHTESFGMVCQERDHWKARAIELGARNP